MALVMALVLITGLLLAGCGNKNDLEAKGRNVSNPENQEALVLDKATWQYDSEHDVYWQVGVSYCANPASDAERLAVYVPGTYMEATENGDGSFTCTVNLAGEVGKYRADTAPIIVRTGINGYGADQSSPTSYNYDAVAAYLKAGYIYVHPGCREIQDGTPLGATDMKAAIRYIKYNNNLIPGDAGRVFAFGVGTAGTMSAIVGASGDSDLYFPYLEAVGAAMLDQEGNYISDGVAGVACWNPVGALDQANAAYEWMAGQYGTDGSRTEGTWTAALSKDLAAAYGDYINGLALESPDGKTLTLDATTVGICNAGTYYDFLKSIVEESLNGFLTATAWPYTPPEQTIDPPVTYQTKADYVQSLNPPEAEPWVTYDEATDKATVHSLQGYVTSQCPSARPVGAFDALDRTAPENLLFGTPKAGPLHFDRTMAGLISEHQDTYGALSGFDLEIVKDYGGDLEIKDDLGTSSDVRADMVNPLFFLSEGYQGYRTSSVAPSWRISIGLPQADMGLPAQVNLAMALGDYPGVETSLFQAVWGQDRTAPESSGTSWANLIDWIDQCIE